MDNFFLKEFLKNTESETIEQEQNISLSSKEIISPEPLAFKDCPTNTMTKNPAWCLFHILNSNKLNHQQ